jgi:hypothetical protein
MASSDLSAPARCPDLVELIFRHEGSLGLTPDQAGALRRLRLGLQKETVLAAAERDKLEMEILEETLAPGEVRTPDTRLQRIEALNLQIRLAETQASARAKALLSPDQQVALSMAAMTGSPPDAGAAAAVGDLERRIGAALEARLKDGRIVEIETAQAIAERLLGWAKLFGYAVGIPLAVLALALGFLGIRSYNDFTALVASAQTEITGKLAQDAKDLETKSAELNATYASLKDKFAQVSTLADNVQALSQKVQQIEEKIGFEPSSVLTPELQRGLEQSISSFRDYLAAFGYKPRPGKIRVYVDPDMQANAYYIDSENRIVLAEEVATDTDVIFRAYAHHALSSVFPIGDMKSVDSAIESGLADYFPCSFSNDSRLGEASVAVFHKPYLRNLDNRRSFKEIAAPNTEVHDAGEVWGGAFWAIRGIVSQEQADRLLFSAWGKLKDRTGDADRAVVFAALIIEGAKAIGEGQYADRIREVFRSRDLKL